MQARSANEEERFALAMLFHGNDAMSDFIEHCLSTASVEREDSGVGFFATIRFPRSLPDTERNQWDWNFVHKGLTHGGSFICWREGDRAITLEGVSHHGDWPSIFDVSDFCAL
jgi:hypothetical protein